MDFVRAAGLLVAGEQVGPAPVIVAAPSAPAALRRRGFDHMALLADQASWEEATYPEDAPAPVAYAPALQPVPQS